MWNSHCTKNATSNGCPKRPFCILSFGTGDLLISSACVLRAAGPSAFLGLQTWQGRDSARVTRVRRCAELTIPTVLSSRTQPLESKLHRLLNVTDKSDKLQLAYIGTAGTAPRTDSDRPLKDQRKKRRYEARAQCKMLGEMFSASSAEHIFLEDFSELCECTWNLRSPKKLAAALKSALGTDGNGLLFVDGGNTFWLWFHAKKAGLGAALREVRRATPFAYVGVSAGAILAGRTCDTAYWKGWDDPTVVPEEEREESLDGLRLVQAAVFPHHGPQWEDTVAECSKNLPPDSGQPLCLTDEDTELLIGQLAA
eukprot:Skav223112  [mRNA]  locus=scaffold419:758745:763469:+ [translate_table: standard]